MTRFYDLDWNNMRRVQQAITDWADSQFPGRTAQHALSKLVLEEVPELLQHKKLHGTKGIDTELADCFVLLMDLASLWGVDLPAAIRAKMIINEKRVWKVDPDTGLMNHTDGVKPLTREEIQEAIVLIEETEGGSHD
jgi:NTP pyrophosphatase (non-canonical NTP hydrolase)